MPITFKVDIRFTADDNRTELSPTTPTVEYRTRYQVAIAPDGRYNGQPKRLQVIVPFRRCPDWPKGPTPDKADPDYPDWKAKWDRANDTYTKNSAAAQLLAVCIADFLNKTADGDATVADPRLTALIQSIYT